MFNRFIGDEDDFDSESYLGASDFLYLNFDIPLPEIDIDLESDDIYSVTLEDLELLNDFYQDEEDGLF